MIRVFHLSDRATQDQRVHAMFGFSEDHAEKCAALWDAGLYDPVAEIPDLEQRSTEEDLTDVLEIAWCLTNSITEFWGDSPRVSCLYDGEGCRSTSVGDVVRAGPEGAQRYFVAASFGFKEFKPAPAEQSAVAPRRR